MTCDLPSISVVIPTRNRSDLVLRALRSVMEQRRKADEVIVVDNGLHRALISELGVRVVLAPVDLGVSQARNIGVALAHHDYIAFLDDDDAWDPGYLDEILNVVASRGSADCLVGALHRMAGGQAIVGKQGTVSTRPCDLIRRNPGFVGSNIVIRRSLLIDLGGFDAGLPASEDVDLAIRLRSAGAAIDRVDSAVALFDADRVDVRLSGQRTLLRGKWRLLRKHVSNPVLRAVYWLEYTLRLIVAERAK